jgi:hypothetical protein
MATTNCDLLILPYPQPWERDLDMHAYLDTGTRSMLTGWIGHQSRAHRQYLCVLPVTTPLFELTYVLQKINMNVNLSASDKPHLILLLNLPPS